MISLRNDLCWHFYACDLSLLAVFNLAFSLGASALFNHYEVRERCRKHVQSRIDGASLSLSLLWFATYCCSCLFLLSLFHSILMLVYFVSLSCRSWKCVVLPLKALRRGLILIYLIGESAVLQPVMAFRDQQQPRWIHLSLSQLQPTKWKNTWVTVQTYFRVLVLHPHCIHTHIQIFQ